MDITSRGWFTGDETSDEAECQHPFAFLSIFVWMHLDKVILIDVDFNLKLLAQLPLESIDRMLAWFKEASGNIEFALVRLAPAFGDKSSSVVSDDGSGSRSGVDVPGSATRRAFPFFVLAGVIQLRGARGTVFERLCHRLTLSGWLRSPSALGFVESRTGVEEIRDAVEITQDLGVTDQSVASHPHSKSFGAANHRTNQI
jgi:hypothetical protein